LKKYGCGLWALGPLGDRFNTKGYKPKLDLAQKIKLIGQIKMVRGVELNYPSDFTEDQLDQVEKLLSDSGLKVSSLCVDLFSDPKWQKGSLTSINRKIRMEAIETIKRALDISERMNWEACSLWLGQDGHDYLFNDYERVWEWLIEGIKEVAEYKNLCLYIEYKPKEPRTHMQISNIGKAIYIIDEVGAKNLGIVIDVGHAFMSDENVAETVAIVSRRKIPFTLHFNDAYGYWDDDMIVGSINLWKYVELFYQLTKVGYDSWYDLDIFPYRENATKAIEQSLKFLDYVKTRVERNYEKIDELISEGDVHKILEGIRKIFLKEYN